MDGVFSTEWPPQKTVTVRPWLMAASAPLTLDSIAMPSFWLLKDSTAPKLDARAEGGIRYQVASQKAAYAPTQSHIAFSTGLDMITA